MNIGRYKRRVTVKRPPTQQDTIGQPVGDWVSVCTVWAYVEPLRGRQLYAAQQAHSEVTTEIGMRYLKGMTTQIKADMRVIDGKELYEIEAVIPRENRREIVLQCKVVT